MFDTIENGQMFCDSFFWLYRALNWMQDSIAGALADFSSGIWKNPE